MYLFDFECIVYFFFYLKHFSSLTKIKFLLRYELRGKLYLFINSNEFYLTKIPTSENLDKF